MTKEYKVGVPIKKRRTKRLRDILHPLCSNISSVGSLSLLLPVGLNLGALLRSHGLTHEWATEKLEHKLAYIVHQLLERQHRQHHGGEWGGYVPINAKQLESLLGPRHACTALSTLVTLNVLERMPQYAAGRFSRSYRLGRDYYDQPLACRVIHDAFLARKLRAVDDTKVKEAIAGIPSRAFVHANLAAVSATPAAHKLAVSRRYASQAEQASWLLALRDLSEGRHWFRASEKSGRVFHPLTQCPKELRRLLAIAGEPSTEVDIANAQPFLLLSLYPGRHPERTAFAASVGAGRLYEDMFCAMDRSGRRSWGYNLSAWSIKSGTHRERFKKHVMRHVLYDQYHEGESASVFKAFERLFPWLASVLAKRRATKEGASALAVEMQKHEADLILGKVIPRVQAELSGCCAITIHDGIMCQRRFAPDVARIVKEEVRAVFGVSPAVRMKPEMKCRRGGRVEHLRLAV